MINSRLYENLHFGTDAFVCPTNSTMESSKKARAEKFRGKRGATAVMILNDLLCQHASSVDGLCVVKSF